MLHLLKKMQRCEKFSLSEVFRSKWTKSLRAFLYRT